VPKSDRQIVGRISRFALAALKANAIVPRGVARSPQPCVLGDFDQAQRVIGPQQSEHRPIIELRFPSVADTILYWHVEDVEFAHPSIVVAMIDYNVADLISKLRQPKIERPPRSCGFDIGG
jgi:protein-tyrosine phosphatase